MRTVKCPLNHIFLGARGTPSLSSLANKAIKLFASKLAPTTKNVKGSFWPIAASDNGQLAVALPASVDGIHELLALTQRGRDELALDLFAPKPRPGSEQLMAIVDQINQREGRDARRIGGVPAKPKWAIRREMLSQRYTTRWEEVIGVRGLEPRKVAPTLRLVAVLIEVAVQPSRGLHPKIASIWIALVAAAQLPDDVAGVVVIENAHVLTEVYVGDAGIPADHEHALVVGGLGGLAEIRRPRNH